MGTFGAIVFIFVGDKDCLAVILAFDNFFFNCWAIFSNSSFFNGVFIFCPLPVVVLVVDVDIILDEEDDDDDDDDVLTVSRSSL